MSDRRLYRTEQDKMVFGVAGGLADYFDIDVSLVRLGWVLVCIASAGLGVLAYIAMTVVTPTYFQLYGVEENGDEAPDDAGDETEGDGDDAEATNAADSVPARRRRPLPRKRRRVRRESGGAGMVFGIIFVVIGGIALMGSLNIFDFLRFGQLWPVLIIAFGGLILWGRRRR